MLTEWSVFEHEVSTMLLQIRMTANIHSINFFIFLLTVLK